MKKIFFLTILFMIFVCNIYANELTLEDPIISFEKSSDYDLQGFTVAQNKLFIVLVDYNDSSSIIKVYNLDNFKLVKEYKFDSLGHANDVTYNSNTNIIYVLHAGGTKTISSFDGSSFEYITTFNIDYPARSITFVDNFDGYIIRNFALSYKLDNSFVCNDDCLFMIIPDLKYETCRQGWAYHDGYLYYANWSWINQGGDGTNTIKRYDMDGNLVDNITTSNAIGELEDLAFYNKKMILGFSGYDKKIVFYEVAIPNISEDKTFVVEETPAEELKKDDKKNNLLYYSAIPFGLCIFIIIIVIIKKHKV